MHTILQHLRQDLMYALRQLRRSPSFALVAVFTLALGIGANTAIFSLMDQALLRSLPVRDPQQLVVLEGTGKAWEGGSSSYGGDVEAYFSYPMYRDLLAQAKTHGVEDLLATSHVELDLTYRSASQIAESEIVSGNYFTMLGATAFRGRMLSPSDDAVPGANPVAVVSYSFWQNHLGGDPSIVGQTVSVNGSPWVIIGIAASGFHSAVWGETPALFIPMSMLGQAMPDRGTRLTAHTERWLNIIGRLAPGESRDQAQTALAPLWHALRADELKTLGTKSLHFQREFLTDSRLLLLPGAGGFSYQRDTLRTPLLVVMGMALLVLLMAAVNVGSLLLVRSAGRVREFSLRTALGAGRARIVAQLLLEGLVIGVMGGALGLAIAPVALRVLVARLTDDGGSSAFSSAVDARVLLFNFVAAIVVSVLFSMAPAFQLRRLDPAQSLRGSNASASGGLLSLRRVIVCLQIGLSVILLVGSGLFVRTMQNLRSVDVGFNPRHLVSFSIAPQLAGYTPERTAGLAKQIEQSVEAMPGVRAIAATTIPEFNGDSHGGNISIAGYTPAPDEIIDVEKTLVNEDFLKAMEIPLLAGRAFTAADDATHPPVALVNEGLAVRYFGSVRNALGKRFMDGSSNKPVYDTEIVGRGSELQADGHPRRGGTDHLSAAATGSAETLPESDLLLSKDIVTSSRRDCFDSQDRSADRSAACARQPEDNGRTDGLEPFERQVDDAVGGQLRSAGNGVGGNWAVRGAGVCDSAADARDWREDRAGIEPGGDLENRPERCAEARRHQCCCCRAGGAWAHAAAAQPALWRDSV